MPKPPELKRYPHGAFIFVSLIVVYAVLNQNPRDGVKESVEMTCGDVRVNVANDRRYIEVDDGVRHYLDKKASIIRGESVYSDGKYALTKDAYLSLYGVTNIKCKITGYA